jgi:hypothetical protein
MMVMGEIHAEVTGPSLFEKLDEIISGAPAGGGGGAVAKREPHAEIEREAGG